MKNKCQLRYYDYFANGPPYTWLHDRNKKGDKLHLYRSLSMGGIFMKRGNSTIQPDIRRRISTLKLSYMKNQRNFWIQIQFFFYISLHCFWSQELFFIFNLNKCLWLNCTFTQNEKKNQHLLCFIDFHGGVIFCFQKNRSMTSE